MTLRALCVILSPFFLLTNCSSDQSVKSTITEVVESTPTYKINWHWEDEFSEKDKLKIEQWILEVSDAVEKTIGIFQFDVDYFFHLTDGNEPVPYAFASRKHNLQAIHFHVNPSYSLDEFLADWTAQHEMSHLSLPFIRKKHMWLSEGYATYLSRKIMIYQGFYTSSEFDSIYYHRIKDDNDICGYPDLTMPKVCEELKSSHNYSSIYYAGSSYFYIADKMLQNKHGITLAAVIKKYQNTNRTIDNSLSEILHSLDKIIDSNLFSSLFKDYQEKPSKDILKQMLL